MGLRNPSTSLVVFTQQEVHGQPIKLARILENIHRLWPFWKRDTQKFRSHNMQSPKFGADPTEAAKCLEFNLMTIQ